MQNRLKISTHFQQMKETAQNDFESVSPKSALTTEIHYFLKNEKLCRNNFLI